METRIVYMALDEHDDWRIRLADATVQEDGSAVFMVDDVEQQREAGTYMTYEAWSRVANSIYTKAVRMAKEKLSNENATK